MSTTFDARDGNAPDAGSPAVALADEETLRRIFLEEYPALTEEARADLGPDARALVSKVVEGAFVRAWDARARFRTPADVHDFLVEDVHHAAARALSRRAGAHRLAGGSQVGSAHTVRDETSEEAWQHIMKALHGEAHSPKALEELARHSRHEAAEHIKHSEQGKPLWIVLGIFAVALAAVLGAAYGMGRVSENEKFTRALNAPDVKPIATTFARMGTVTLDDGTKVRLAPESELTVPKLFGPELRVVKLKGAGEFTVAKGIEQPFRVNAGTVAVVATGTAFTVKVDENTIETTVVVSEGSVKVGKPKELTDVPAGGAVIAKDSVVRQATAAEKEEADSWRSGTLVVNDRPLSQVLNLMKKWYGLTILVPQPKLMERKASFRASLDSTRQAIRGIEASTGLQFGYVGQNMAFTEPTAKPEAAGAKKAKK